MAFFPFSIMPKHLQKETAREVDDSPSIYNAKDYNIHHRELLAIERFLVGDGLGEEDGGLLKTVSEVLSAITRISTGGLIARHGGLINNPRQIAIPDSAVSTFTDGAIGPADTSISVISTDGFPDSGIITKFNDILPNEELSDFDSQKYEFGPNITNQEIIEYSGKTDTAFTGCSRGIDGTTAQAVVDGDQAVVTAGRASLFLSNTFWTASGGKPVQLLIKQTSSLVITPYLVSLVKTALDQDEIGFVVTAAGRAIGLLAADVNNNASHSLLAEIPGLDTFDHDPLRRVLSSGVRGRRLSATGVEEELVGAGGIFITGHDPDYHAIRGNNQGSINIIRRAVEYVTFNAASPSMLLVTDVENPGGDQVDSRLGLAAAGYSFDVADYGSGEPGILDLALINFSDYEVVVIASSYGGWLRQRELDILLARSGEVLDYINGGGGLVAFSESGPRAGDIPLTAPYKYIPFVISINGRYASSANIAYGLTTVGSFEDVRIPQIG
jgi:hypothetical protein